ncbi:MAG: choice-of-anchor B family protein [bacterium]
MNSILKLVLTTALINLLHLNTLNAQSQHSLTLLAHVPFPGKDIADVWGYVDTNTGREYALVGHGIFADPPFAGLIIVDVTVPQNPTVVAVFDSVPGFDVKAFQHFAYTVNGLDNGEGKVVDIANPAEPKIVGSFPSAHNIFIAKNGYMYLEDPGLKILDLNADPTNPALVWDSGDFRGHDAAVIGDRLFDFHGFSGTNIYDVSNPADPQLLGSITDKDIAFHHSGWVTEDGQFLFICDELADQSNRPADITIWDISAPAAPQKVNQIADPNATVHNLYIVNNFAVASYYSAGLRIFDVSQPASSPIPIEAEFDTAPQLSGPRFGGAFGAYPFAPSGNIYVSDEGEGLFVFSFAGLTTSVPEEGTRNPDSFLLFDNYPNPFNPATTIAYQLPVSTHVRLVIYNLLGQTVRTLADGFEEPGTKKVVWDGRDDAQDVMPAGVYFYRITTSAFQKTKRLVLLK